MLHNVIERSWYGERMSTPQEMSREQYGRDMADVLRWGETVNVWVGTDRQGNLLKVVWVTRPRMGQATLYAYELSGE